MPPFNQNPLEVIPVGPQAVHVFAIHGENIDARTVESFGEEWTKFNHFTEDEIRIAGDQYFDIVFDADIRDKEILDVGCGTGRWSKYLAGRARRIESIDPSDAVYAAAQLLKECSEVRISRASVNNIPFADESFDFVFSLGVLHHIPDTARAMRDCVKKVKPGGRFLVYLYYSLDNRGAAFKALFTMSNVVRRVISGLPPKPKKIVCDLIAVGVYLPFVGIAKALQTVGLGTAAKSVPLSYYTDKSFHIIKNDALDRFGTPLEQRFSREEIQRMMAACGLTNIRFSEREPYWHAVGEKPRDTPPGSPQSPEAS